MPISKPDILAYSPLQLRSVYHRASQPKNRLSSISRHFSTSKFNMAPIPSEVDYLVIGGGSGGVASARRAAAYKASVLIVEKARWGGTCVNVGCVPKKMTWYAADIAEKIKHSTQYGFSVTTEAPFNWKMFKEKRDASIKKLNGRYVDSLEKEGVTHVHGTASFVNSNNVVEITLDNKSKQLVKAEHILIATGGHPDIPTDVPGADLGITSDGFFKLDHQPKKVAVIGAGYIAVEFAGMFNTLGTETHLFIRHENFLRTFDPMLQQKLADEYRRQGIHLHTKSEIVSAQETDTGDKRIQYKDENGNHSLNVDYIVWAIGRSPDTQQLGLDKTGIKTTNKGRIAVDEYQNTNKSNIYAVGDVCDKGFELTPVAIAAGRRLADRLFGKETQKGSHLDYENIPSVVFSHPTIGSIGLTEPEARKKYGQDNIKVHNNDSISLYNSMFEQSKKTVSNYKLVTQGANEKVVGLHIIGEGSDEILQGFGVAIKMGATKADFDNCVAIHPTSAEEIVTMK